jgi:hypothetical protein
MLFGIALALADTTYPIPLQGTLTDAGGQPLNGTVEATFRIYGGEAATPGSHTWSDGLTVAAIDGAFSAWLGSSAPLLPEDLPDTPWITVTVGGVESAPVPVGWSPLALRSFDADHLGGLPPSAWLRDTPTIAGARTFLGAAAFPAGATVGGDLSTSGAGRFVGDGSGLTSLPASVAYKNTANTWTGLQTFSAGLTASGDVTVASGSSFIGDGSGLTALPSNVALKSAANTWASLQTLTGATSSGDITVTGTGRFVGDGSGLTNLPAAGGQTTTANTWSELQTFSKGIKLGTGASATCTDTQAGTIRWTGIAVQVCGGTTSGWVTLASTSPGLTQSDARQSCAALLAAGATTSGYYWIDPNGAPTTDASRTYCDQTTDGGGWTMVWGNMFSGDEGGPNISQLNAAYGTPDLAGDFGLAPTVIFDQLGATRMLVKEGTNWLRFNSMTSTKFSQLFNMSPDQSWSVTSINGSSYTVNNGYHGHGSGVNQFGQSAVNSTVIFEFNTILGARDTNHFWHIWPAADGTYAVNAGVGGNRYGSIWLK